MIDPETIAVYDEQIESYAKLDKRHQETVDQVLLNFMNRITPGGYVLDLGCGPATASSIMRDNGLRVDPVDASNEMVKLANKTHDIGARNACFDEISAIETYDGIWANFSLLHATDSEFPNILHALYKAMKPGGTIHLGMKTGTGSARDNLGRFYTYYSQDELKDKLTAAGFQVVEAKSGEGRGLAGDIEPWLTLTGIAVAR